jgi:hypothetical protein
VTAPADAKAGEQKNVLLFASEKGRTNELDKQLVRAVVIRTTTLEAAAVVDALNADPGRPMDFVVKFRNNGNAIENLTIDMTQLPAGWTSVITPDRFQLADGGQERSVVVTVLSPADALAGSYPLEVQARNADQVRLLSATAALGARINQVYGGQISTETPVLRILPKDQAAVQFQVTNTGNGPDAFLIDGLPSTWDVKVDPPVTPLLAPGASALIQVSGTFSGQVGTQKVPLFLVSQGQGQAVNDQPLPFTLIVSRPDLYVKSAKVVSKADHAGDLEVIAAEIENLGGIEAKKVTVALFVDGKPTGITATFDRLAPERTLVASLPWTKTAGDHSYRIEVDPENQIDEGEGEGNNAVVLKAGTLETQGLQVLGSEGKIASQLSPATGAWTALLLVALAAAWTRRRRDA